MLRHDDARYDPWAVYHCFELRIKNPYEFAVAREAYKPFNIAEKPKCSSTDANTVVDCRYRSRYTLQFWFSKLSDDEADSPS